MPPHPSQIQPVPERFSMQQVIPTQVTVPLTPSAPGNRLENPLLTPMPRFDTPTSRTDAAVPIDMENFESQMVDKAMSNLPNVFTEVFTMQKGQTNDIQTLQQMVRENKERIAEIEEKRDELLQEVSSLTKRIFLTDENINENRKSCKLLTSDLKRLVVQLYESQQDVRLKAEDTDLEMRKLEQHKAKKAKFADNVDDYERKTSEMQKQIDSLNIRLDTLKKQKMIMDKDQAETARVVNGIVEREIQSDIDDLRKKIKLTEAENEQKQEKVTKEKENQRQMNQTIQVLQKRNSAQMTRLRRQLKDVQSQNKQWANQISNLESKVSQLRHENPIFLKDQNMKNYQHYIDVQGEDLPTPRGTTTAVATSKES